jgi:hypothetical protein
MKGSADLFAAAGEGHFFYLRYASVLRCLSKELTYFSNAGPVHGHLDSKSLRVSLLRM